MRVRSVIPCVLSLSLLALAVGCSKQEAPKQEAPPAAGGAADGKTLFDRKCSVCHGLDRSTARTGTKEKWEGIIKDMQGKKADWISDADAAKILDYLVAEHGTK